MFINFRIQVPLVLCGNLLLNTSCCGVVIEINFGDYINKLMNYLLVESGCILRRNVSYELFLNTEI